jgi:predicted RecA/RadA family phage recombinase
MANLSFTAANLIASSAAVRRLEYNAAATLARGDLVYLNSSNAWALCDANAAATGNGITNLRGIVEADAAAGQRVPVIIKDPGMTAGATLTKGVIYVASADAGKIAPSTDLASGWYRVPVAAAISTTVWNFDPNALATGATD